MFPTKIRRRGKALVRLSAILILVAAHFFSALAGPIGLTPLAVTAGKPAGAMSLSEIERINPFNGQLSFAIPLLTIGGRGKVSHTITLPIQRRLQVSNIGIDRCSSGLCGPDCSPETCGIDFFKQLQPVINNTAFPAPVALRGEREGAFLRDSTGTFTSYISTLSRFTLTMADGTEIELRDKNTNGQPFEWSGLTAPPGFPRGTDFVSADGTFATFYSNDPIVDRRPLTLPEPIPPYCGGQTHCITMTTPSGFVMMADGTRYDISQGRTTRMSDSNGNRIEFVYSQQQTPTGQTVTVLSSIKDPLDREVTLNWSIISGNAYDEIQYKGVNQAPRSIKIFRQTLENTLQAPGPLPTKGVLYPELNPNDTTKDNPNVISRVELANGRSYTFKYNPYGEPARVELPTGGVIEYDFSGGVQNGTASGLYGDIFQISTQETFLYRRLTERRLVLGSTLVGFTTYSKSDIWNANSIITRTSPLPFIDVKAFEAQNATCHDNQTCQLLGVERHFYNSSAANSYAGSPLSSNFKLSRYPLWTDGKEFKTELLDVDGTTVLRRQELTWDQPGSGWWTSMNAPQPTNNPRVIEIKQTVITPGGVTLVSKKTARNPVNQTIAFDQFNNQTDLWEFDFGNGTPGQLLRHTHTDYVTDTAYTGSPNDGNAHLRRLVRGQQLYSVNSATNQDVAVVAASETVYDETNFLTPDYSSLTGWVDPNRNARGNPTTNKTWLNFNGTSFQTFPQGSFLTTHSEYDQGGSVVRTVDALGRETTVACTDADGTNTKGNHAFPTLTTSPIPDSSGVHGSSTPLTSSRTYDHSTGLVITSTDVRGQLTTVEYNDPLSRPTRMVPPTGGGEIVFEYVDDPQNPQNPGTVYNKIKAKIDQNTWDETFNYFDGLGRKVKTESHDAIGTIFSETVYDSLGRVTKTSSPYRAGDTKLWVETVYDALGRAKEVISPKIAGEAVAAKIISEYSTSALGLVTVGTNQAGHKTRSIINGLGQLVRFDESNGSNDLGTVDSPAQPTHYKYDPLGNLRRVTQGDQDPDSPNFNPQAIHQSRFYLYDSAGRLVRLKQPEQDTNTTLAITDPLTNNNQWSSGFTYFASGSVETTTDPKGAVTTFSYDTLGRPFQRAYSLPQTTDPKKITVSTSTVTMKYDGLLSPAPDNPNPALVQFAKGSLTEISNGTSMTQHTGFDRLGRILSSKQVTDGQAYNFSYEYNLEGTLTSQVYPSGRVVTQTFDSAGDVSSVGSGSVLYASNLRYTTSGVVDQMQFGNLRWQTLKLNTRQQVTEIALGTSATDTSLWKVNYDYGRFNANGTIDVAKNDGNVIQQTITVPGVAAPFVQTYKYDPVNRLSEALEKNSNNEVWKQTYGYDRFGNRNSFTYQINQTPVTLNTTNNPGIDPWTSRINSAGYDYDFNGNLISEPQGRKFSFDADNKQREIKDSGNQVIATYAYDGSGRRIKKISGGQQTVFVYNAKGQLIAEYSNQPSASSGTTYITSDILNSPRVLTNQNGDVISRRDFMPFGEAIAASRSSNQKYGINDGLRKSFTGYERDTESSLDLAEARYYNPAHGRFTAVDPLLVSGISSNPQTFNRYVYAGNNPTRRTDPNGEAWYIKDLGLVDGIRTFEYFWDNRNLTLIYQGPKHYIVRMNWGHYQGLVALDPWEARLKIVNSVAEGRQQLERWKQEAALNYIAGAAEAHSLVLELSGALDGVFKIDRNSQQYKLGSNVGTIASTVLAAGGGPSLVNFLLKRAGTGAKFLARELNIVGRGRTVIGHSPTYVKLAESLGATFHNVPAEVWDQMTDIQRWDNLKGFLDQAIARGDEFILATPLNQIKEGSWYAREIKYLLSKGYVPNASGTALVPGR